MTIITEKWGASKTRVAARTAGCIGLVAIALSGGALAQQAEKPHVGEVPPVYVKPDPGTRALSQPSKPKCQPSESYLEPTASSEGVDPRTLEGGWLAGNLIGQKVTGSDGEVLGEVDDILVGPDKKITGISVETAGFLGLGATSFKVAWSNVNLTPNAPGVDASVSQEQAKRLPPHRSPRAVQASGEEFRVSDILGDWTRIGNRTTLCYEQRGHVEDVVFDRNGGLAAVIEQRSEDLGGGFYAYPFLSYQQGWRPFYGYYDLPLEHMDDPAARVDLGKFEQSPATAG